MRHHLLLDLFTHKEAQRYGKHTLVYIAREIIKEFSEFIYLYLIQQ